MSAFTDTTTFKAIQAFKVRQDNYNSDTFVAKTDAGDSNVIENISVDGVNQQINSDTKTATIDLSAYAKKSELGSVLTYKGSVLNMAALPTDTSVLKIGDVYNLEQAGGVDIKGIVVTAGDNVAWTGSGWDVLAGSVDLSNYLTETIASDTYLAQSDASDTYLAQSDASDTYLAQSDAETLYLAQSDAAGTYLAQSDAAANYVSNSNLQVTLSGYVQTETGKSLSTNDFTTAEKSKLGGIETGAQVNKIENVSIDGTIQTINSDTKVLVLDLSNYATKAEVASVLKYKGSVQSFSALPSNAAVGDVYNIEQAGGTDVKGTAVKAGDNVAKTSAGWDVLAGTIDLSAYLTSAQAAATYITNASLQSALSAAVPSGVVLSTVASTVEGAIWIGE